MTNATLETEASHQAAQSGERISIHPLADELQAAQHWLLLDVRTPFEYKESHIKDSWNVPLHDLERYMDEIRKQAEGRTIVTICRSGARAAKARKMLLKAAISDDVRVLEGGVSAWAREGQTLRYGRGGMSIERQVRIAAGSMVALGTALGFFVSPWFLIVPAFVGLGLTFAGITNTCGMAKMLMRMPFNRLKQLASCPLQQGENVGNQS